MDDGYGWVIDAIERCLPHAERRGVLLLLENHWGLTTFAHDMASIIETIDSPWLQAILDMGNFLFEEDMYAAMARIAPHVCSRPCQNLPRRRLLVQPRPRLRPHLPHPARRRLARLLLYRNGRRRGRRNRSPQEHRHASAGLGRGNLAVQHSTLADKTGVLRGSSWPFVDQEVLRCSPWPSVALRGQNGFSSRPSVDHRPSTVIPLPHLFAAPSCRTSPSPSSWNLVDRS